MKGRGGGKAGDGEKVVATNRRARFDYEIEDTWEAGLVLTGSEVKSLREANVNLSDAYAMPRGAELFLVNLRIGEKVEQRGYTLVPLRLYFKDGWAKVELGLGKGRTHEDRRGAIEERESRREMDRAVARARRR